MSIHKRQKSIWREKKLQILWYYVIDVMYETVLSQKKRLWRNFDYTDKVASHWLTMNLCSTTMLLDTKVHFYCYLCCKFFFHFYFKFLDISHICEYSEVIRHSSRIHMHEYLACYERLTVLLFHIALFFSVSRIIVVRIGSDCFSSL